MEIVSNHEYVMCLFQHHHTCFIDNIEVKEQSLLYQFYEIDSGTKVFEFDNRLCCKVNRIEKPLMPKKKQGKKEGIK